MEKRGVVDPDITPEVEQKPPQGQKQASKQTRKERTEALDDDASRRMADAATKRSR